LAGERVGQPDLPVGYHHQCEEGGREGRGRELSLTSYLLFAVLAWMMGDDDDGGGWVGRGCV